MEAELSRIKLGHEKNQCLLANWDEETAFCLTDGGRECKRNAEPVRKHLGQRSTTDPLFQIEKVFLKTKNMEIDPVNAEDFFSY